MPASVAGGNVVPGEPGSAAGFATLHRSAPARAVLATGDDGTGTGGAAERLRLLGEVLLAEALKDAMRVSEERLRVALEGSPITVFQQDRDLRYTWIHNPPSGVRAEDIVSRTDADLVAAEESARLIELKRGVMETGEVVRAEVRAPTAVGPRSFDVTVEPLLDAGGRVVGVTGSAVDVTELKAREERIARLQEVTAGLSEAVTAAQIVEVIVHRAIPAAGAEGGSVSLVSEDRTAFQIAGAVGMPGQLVEAWRQYPIGGPFPLAEAARTGRPVFIETPGEWWTRYPETAPDFSVSGYQAFASVPVIFEGRLLGGIGFDFIEARRFSADDRAFMVAVAQQCAQALDRARLYEAERRTRDAAEEAEARYRSLFDQVPDAIVIADAEGRYVDVNPALSALLGYSRDELLRLRLGDVSTGQEGARQDLARRHDQRQWRGESELRRKDGATVPVEAWLRRVDRPTGPFYIGVMRDISVRRDHERQQQEFFASVSHDLKNPLAAIKGQIQLMQRRARRGKLHPDQVGEGLEAISSVAVRMAGMIEELVDVAQLRAGQPLHLNRQPVDLVDLVRHCAREHQRSTTHHAIQIESTEETLVGWWDEARLRRVLDNLITNAVKYSPEGGPITIRVARAERAGKGWAIETVVDHGVGIPAADLPHIFERFRRGSNVLDQVAGSGIGLAGARQIVTQHGGTIAIDSREGAGTTVTVALPLAEPEE